MFYPSRFWYWEIDGGGPSRRHAEGYRSEDFVFPQSSLEQLSGVPWIPHYVDYLFLAFNASTAFSPTDTLVLSVRAKLLMMIQSLISLVVLAIIAARAINTIDIIRIHYISRTTMDGIADESCATHNRFPSAYHEYVLARAEACL